MALTEKQVEGVLAASKELDAITDKIPENAKPDPKVDAQLDAVAKKNGFASYAEYNDVTDNISMVLAGFDPATKQYVGAEAVLKAQIAAVQADKKMPAKDKKQALAEMNEALKSPAPAIENKGNIDLVAKYYDKLAAALQDDQ
jgi:transcriptional regulator of aromatic amino acid metabolism